MKLPLLSRLLGLGLIAAALSFAIPSQAALDDPSHVVTVMQFTAKSPESMPELKKRMQAMRDFLRKQPGYVENALFENRNPQTSPQYVGVSQWKKLKDWENLWQGEQFQLLMRAIGEVGTVSPGIYSAVK
jgi:heme-degrading monooxygenase HmoA